MRGLLSLVVSPCLLGILIPLAGPAISRAATPAFYADVLPILQRRCQSCHRPGEAAPMPLLTYEQTRPWAAAVREAVLTRRMPPWGADAAYGHFANDPSLTTAERETISQWAQGGAPAGERRDAPAPVRFVEGWNIGQPDLVLALPHPVQVAAKGAVAYVRVILPLGLAQDRWVTAAEIRPGNRRVVHHVTAFLRESDSKWLAGAPAGEPLPKPAPGGARPDDGLRENLVTYAPGTPPFQAAPGRARLIKAGSDLVLELHYTPDGSVTTDQTRVGLRFASQPPRERISGVAIGNIRFVLPPYSPDVQVEARGRVPRDWMLLSLTPHMHLRGKAFEVRARYPNGERETLLRVPHYDFQWQFQYFFAEPKRLPAGTILECVAAFDNSANNPRNPDPSAEVRWGDQSEEEMMIGFLEIVYPATRPPAEVFQPSP